MTQGACEVVTVTDGNALGTAAARLPPPLQENRPLPRLLPPASLLCMLD